jgi:hypothetical protein
MFFNINDAQLCWYNTQIQLDKKEDFEFMRDVAEHNAMFSNPEGVQKVRESRENSYKVSDEDFEKIIEENFGKEINESDKKQFNFEEFVELKKKNKDLDTYHNIDEFDDIIFTPFKRG